MNRMVRLVTALGLVVAAGACSTRVKRIDCEKEPSKCPQPKSEGQPQFYATPPFGVGFSCVLVGCLETKTIIVENRGEGSLKIPVARLAVDASPEFTLAFAALEASGTTSLQPPADVSQYELRGGDRVAISITYQPTDAVSDATSLRVDWYDGVEDYQHANIHRVEMPISTRVLGSASSALRASQLNFGYVPVGTDLVATVDLENTSLYDAVLEVTDVTLLAGSSTAYALEIGWTPFANPGGEIKIPVRFAPATESAHFGTLLVTTNDESMPVRIIDLVGTAIEGPELVVLQPEDLVVDFGDVRYGETRDSDIIVRNDGGATLEATVSLFGDNAFRLGDDAPTHVSLAPFETAIVPVHMQVNTDGSLGAEVTFAPGHIGSAPVVVRLMVFGELPRLALNTSTLNFGTLAQGWVTAPRTITVTNVGAGELRVSDVSFELGSSAEVRISGALPLPMSISPGDPPLQIPVYVAAEALGPVHATLIIHSDAIDVPVARVDVLAQVATCSQACPVANGSPLCDAGSCQIDSCKTGWNDLDGTFATGCECQSERSGNDIGSTCFTGFMAPTLGDKCTSKPAEVTYTGNLSSPDDIDLYYFRTEDGGGVFCDTFSDSAATKVQLVNGPPGLAMCVRIADNGTGCGGYTTFYDPALCSSTNVVQDGHAGPNDNHDNTVWLMWKPGAAPVCASYTIKFRGRD
jgi:hypothetical protein